MSEQTRECNKRYKVGRVLSEYDLLDLHDSLPDLWRGESSDPMSLRELADHINIAVLERAMEDAGETPLDGESENAYRLLTGDDVSVGMQTQQRSRLTRAGIDVDRLEDDFVTHQAVHTYLTDALDVSKDVETADPVETGKERIERLRGRTTAVVENTLSELQNAGHLSGGSYDIFVDVQVYCSECETQTQLSELLAAGGCECE
ncbi:rod-determining factor RdfA [Halovenus marina]|uniref:rod-determining factor RdfA n=1 Tax=Halovenus marina TaxID=3396621 RepID=UPI003F56B587